MPRIFAAACALLVLLGAGSAHAINITYGDVVVRRLGSYGFTATNSVLSFDSGGTDQLYQMFGYLSNANGTAVVQGANFNVLSNISQTAPDQAQSSVILDNNGAAVLGLSAGDIQIDYTFTLVDDTTPLDADGFLWDITLTNHSAVDLDLVFYQYMDLDLGGASDYADDIVDANLNRIWVTDADSAHSYVWHASNNGTADHFAVQSYPGLRDLLDAMGPATDLADAAANFGPADFTGAFQYNITIPAGGSFLLGGTEVTTPEPKPPLLMLLGLAGLYVYSRPRRV